METYGPALVTLLEQYTTPDEVCKALKLCTTQVQAVEGMRDLEFPISLIKLLFLLNSPKTSLETDRIIRQLSSMLTMQICCWIH